MRKMRPLSPEERRIVEFIRSNKEVLVIADDGKEEVRLRLRGGAPKLIAMAVQEAISKSRI